MLLASDTSQGIAKSGPVKLSPLPAGQFQDKESENCMGKSETQLFKFAKTFE